MNRQVLSSHNILIAEYTLGLLDRHDMARAHQLLGHDDAAVAAALEWEQNLLELTDLLAPVDPSPLLLQRIQTALGHDTTPSAASLFRQPSSLQSRDPALEARHDEAGTEKSQAGQTMSAAPRAMQPRLPAGGKADGTASRSAAMPSPISPGQTPAPSTRTGTENPAAVKSSNDTAPRHQEAPTASPEADGATPPEHDAPTPRIASVTQLASARAASADTAARSHNVEHTIGSLEPTASSPIRREPSSIQPRPTSTRPAQGLRQASPPSSPSPRKDDSATAVRGTSLSSPVPPSSSSAPGATSGASFAQADIGSGARPSTATPTSPAGAMSSGNPLPPSSRSMLGSVWLWRVTTLVFAAIALALALLPSQPAKPPINVVKVAPTRAAILQAPGQSSTPGWIVTFDPQGNVRMAPQVHSDVPADSSVQLWTHNETLPQPRSLGLIDPNEPVTIPANLMGQPGKSQFFEMTLEPQGGSASPSGPVLFIGRVVTFGQAAQADAAATPPTSQPAS